MITHSQYSSWERKAIRAHIRIVASAPLNIHRSFEHHANKQGKSHTQPPCHCTAEHLRVWAQGGKVLRVGKHFALLPVTIQHQGAPLRGTDPLPCSDTKSRHQAIQSLVQMASTLHIQHQYTRKTVSDTLPIHEWDTTVPLRFRVQCIAENLRQVAYIRVADKGATVLFAFCRQWVWDLIAAIENYVPQPLDDTQRIMRSLQDIIRKNQWPMNTSRTVPLLYLLGKAKSMLKGMILWRPIAAIAKTQLQRFYLRTAARAFTLFLRLLVEEITASFLVLKIVDLQPWVGGLCDWECSVIGEADCSGQFNNIHPLSVMKDFREAIKWLAQRKRWNATHLIWSIHQDNKTLDRIGVGTTSRFIHLPHTDLKNLVHFSLLTDTFTHASGQLWSRTATIPMGGPFNAQSAHLRSAWGAQKQTDLMRRLGTLTFSPRGHPLWTTPRGNQVSLAQFRDNVLVGARVPTAPREMQHVCNILSRFGTFRSYAIA